MSETSKTEINYNIPGKPCSAEIISTVNGIFLLIIRLAKAKAAPQHPRFKYYLLNKKLLDEFDTIKLYVKKTNVNTNKKQMPFKILFIII